MELGAAAPAVLVAEDSSVEMVYPSARPIMLSAELLQVLIGRSGSISVEDPLAAFLASNLAGRRTLVSARSFECEAAVVVIVFGFAECRQPDSLVPVHVGESIKLAARAAWSAKEIARLPAAARGELSVRRTKAGRAHQGDSPNATRHERGGHL